MVPRRPRRQRAGGWPGRRRPRRAAGGHLRRRADRGGRPVAARAHGRRDHGRRPVAAPLRLRRGLRAAPGHRTRHGPRAPSAPDRRAALRLGLPACRPGRRRRGLHRRPRPTGVPRHGAAARHGHPRRGIALVRVRSGLRRRPRRVADVGARRAPHPDRRAVRAGRLPVARRPGRAVVARAPRRGPRGIDRRCRAGRLPPGPVRVPEASGPRRRHRGRRRRLVRDPGAGRQGPAPGQPPRVQQRQRLPDLAHRREPAGRRLHRGLGAAPDARVARSRGGPCPRGRRRQARRDRRLPARLRRRNGRRVGPRKRVHDGDVVLARRDAPARGRRRPDPRRPLLRPQPHRRAVDRHAPGAVVRLPRRARRPARRPVRRRRDRRLRRAVQRRRRRDLRARPRRERGRGRQRLASRHPGRGRARRASRQPGRSAGHPVGRAAAAGR